MFRTHLNDKHYLVLLCTAGEGQEKVYYKDDGDACEDDTGGVRGRMLEGKEGGEDG